MANFDIDRTRRVAGLVKRELAHIISREMNDDRINKVTVTHVDMSKDLKNARVFIASMEKNANPAMLEQQLTRAGKFIRQRLSQALDLRVTPKLQFKYDETLDRAISLETLMQSLNHKDSSTYAQREEEQGRKDNDEE